MEPWPKTYTYWHREKAAPIRLILGPVNVESSRHTPSAVRPGTILEAAADRLVIAAGTGTIAPQTVQLAGKRAMPIAEVLRGHKIQPGDRFGPE